MADFNFALHLEPDNLQAFHAYTEVSGGTVDTDLTS